MKHFHIDITKPEEMTEIPKSFEFTEGQLFAVNQILMTKLSDESYDEYLKRVLNLDSTNRIRFIDFPNYARTFHTNDVISYYCIEDRKKYDEDLAEIARLNSL